MIRKAKLQDYSVCANIYANAWNKALPVVKRTIGLDDFEKETDGELIFVASVNKQVSGYISIWQPDWFVHHLYVDPGFHGRGIGKGLMVFAASLAKPHVLSLKCQVANANAIGFYKSLGFIETEERGVDEYGDWILLRKD